MQCCGKLSVLLLVLVLLVLVAVGGVDAGTSVVEMQRMYVVAFAFTQHANTRNHTDKSVPFVIPHTFCTFLVQHNSISNSINMPTLRHYHYLPSHPQPHRHLPSRPNRTAPSDTPFISPNRCTTPLPLGCCCDTQTHTHIPVATRNSLNTM